MLVGLIGQLVLVALELLGEGWNTWNVGVVRLLPVRADLRQVVDFFHFYYQLLYLRGKVEEGLCKFYFNGVYTTFIYLFIISNTGCAQ
jgi:hypothetical protein